MTQQEVSHDALDRSSRRSGRSRRSRVRRTRRKSAPGPGAVVVTIIPGGGTFFTEGKDTQGPSFGNYDLGGGVAVNFNRYVGVEGEVSGALGVTQDLAVRRTDVEPARRRTCSTTAATSWSRRRTSSSVVPYVTGGVGGLSLFEKASLGINDTETFFTGNVGGGVKWYAGRWGLRGDYRFIARAVEGRRAASSGRKRATAIASTAACC